MKAFRLTFVGLFSMIATVSGASGFAPIFDGRSLSGWETPDPSYWTVEDGAITGRITTEHPCAVNQYLVWAGGELADFELKLKSRLNGEGGINNGFQFRSRLLPDHDICGYQMDNNLQTPWLVRLYDEFGRHTLALRGEKTFFNATGMRTTSTIEEANGEAWFRLEDWHEYHLICVGPKITLRVNGRLAAEVEDLDLRRQELQGVLALQLHSGPPTTVQFKDIEIKILKTPEESPTPASTRPDSTRSVLLNQAAAWWPLDAGGHGAKPSLRHIPGWSEFELNVKADGPGARPGAKAVLLDGAYFESGPELLGEAHQITVFLRARDPRGEWIGALAGKSAEPDYLGFRLFGAKARDSKETEIGFMIRTDRGDARVAFPISQIDTRGWHDFVGRYDGSTLALFCDGRLMASQTHSGAIPPNNQPLLIGAEMNQGKATRHFHGELEETALWSRGLSDQEIGVLTRYQ